MPGGWARGHDSRAIAARWSPVLISTERAGQSGGAGVSLRIIPIVGPRWFGPVARHGQLSRQVGFHEPIRFRSRDQRLDPDRGRQPRGQCVGDHPGPGPGQGQRHRPLPGALRHRLHLRRPVRPGVAARRGLPRRSGGSPGRRRAGSSSSSSGCRCRSRTACSIRAAVLSDGKVLGVVPKQSHPQLQGVLRESLVPPGRRLRAGDDRAGGRGRPLRHRPALRVRGSRGQPGHGGGRDLRGPLGADPSQLDPGGGRGHGAAQSFGQQRDHRQEPVPDRPGGGAVGPLHRGLRLRRRGAFGIDDRPGLRRALPDRRERPARSRNRRRVGDGQADPPRLLLDHAGRGRRQAPGRPPGLDELRAAAQLLPPLPAHRLRAVPRARRPEARRAGHALRPAGRPRAAPPLRGDLRDPVCGAGQANRAAPGRHAAEYRDLRRAGLDALPARLREDVRPAGHRPAADPRADDARLRDHRHAPGTTPWT